MYFDVKDYSNKKDDSQSQSQFRGADSTYKRRVDKQIDDLPKTQVPTMHGDKSVIKGNAQKGP